MTLIVQTRYRRMERGHSCPQLVWMGVGLPEPFRQGDGQGKPPVQLFFQTHGFERLYLRTILVMSRHQSSENEEGVEMR